MYLCLDLVQSLPGLCFCAVCVWQCDTVLNRQWVPTYPETARLLTRFLSTICDILCLQIFILSNKMGEAVEVFLLQSRVFLTF